LKQLAAGAHAEFLLGLIADQPDLTLDEIVAAMRKRRIAGSRSAVWRFFARRNISFKKTLYAAEQKRADVARARRRSAPQQRRQQGLADFERITPQVVAVHLNHVERVQEHARVVAAVAEPVEARHAVVAAAQLPRRR
jgi:hypothetical protein